MRLCGANVRFWSDFDHCAPHFATYVGELGGDERHAADGGGEESRARRHAHGREALQLPTPDFIKDAIRAGAPKFDSHSTAR